MLAVPRRELGMPETPSYLGLLNRIAVGESQGHKFLSAWAAATPDPDVRCVLEKVAIREGEHGLAFTKRINELGFSVETTDDPGLDERLAGYGPGVSDVEKFKKLGIDKVGADGISLFDDVFKDHSIDIQTAELLGRYIAEEQDSVQLLRCCYKQLVAKSGSPATDRVVQQVAAIDAKVDALCHSIDELRQIVSARTLSAVS